VLAHRHKVEYARNEMFNLMPALNSEDNIEHLRYEEVIVDNHIRASPSSAWPALALGKFVGFWLRRLFIG
jgi:hypothetical protein